MCEIGGDGFISYKQTEICFKSTKTTLFEKKMICQLYLKTFNQSKRDLLFDIDLIYDILILRNKCEYMEGGHGPIRWYLGWGPA